MSAYKKILAFANPHKKYIFASLFFNILYSVFQIVSASTILPVLGMLLGTIKKTKTATEPEYSGKITEYFNYLKDYAYYFIELKVEQHGALTVLAYCTVFRSIDAYLLSGRSNQGFEERDV